MFQNESDIAWVDNLVQNQEYELKMFNAHGSEVENFTLPEVKSKGEPEAIWTQAFLLPYVFSKCILRIEK